jgi:predicted transcriptional regulator
MEGNRMAEHFPDTLNVKLPRGAKEQLAKVAARRYQTPTSIARGAIMSQIEKSLRDDSKTENVA